MPTTDTNIVAGLFGIGPQQAYQQIQQQGAAQDAQAFNSAGGTPGQLMAQAYSGVGRNAVGLGAGLMGIEPTAVTAARQREQVMQGADTGTPEGLMAIAKRFNDAGMPQQAAMAVQAARQMQEELSKMANEEAKTKLAEVQATEIPKQRHEEAMARIQQAADAAKQRSLDFQLSVAQRREAAQQHNQLMRVLADNKSQEKPMTEAQRYKFEKERSVDKQAIQGLDDALNNTKEALDAIANHPGLTRATGIIGMAPSIPGSDASKAANLIEEFKNGVKMTGLNLVRQGGSIGMMTEREWPIVEGMVAQIDPKTGADQVKMQMRKVISKMEQIKKNAQAKHDELYGTQETGTGKSSVSAPTVPAKSTIDRFNSEVDSGSWDDWFKQSGRPKKKFGVNKSVNKPTVSNW